ncbi:glycosyltransferase [Cytobacillus oceanisediminis]|uniref:glycosyltransferase family 2 protein n=1 Tax=Cytobacillus oceanisediminis TaxID=665099 RepID=UPI001CCCE025|nr:glycosyltransferase [Cytobacillus oceanisediminis]MBZ9536856.1 glycosyltransferase [Cytobacillus oceanisediminis]
MNSKISIIVPVYNVANYIDRCVTSLIKQTYNNLEIILINDGSTDASGDICDRYSETDSRIIVIHKENGGLSDARNKGLDIASGEYIAFVDSDDYINKEMYSLLYESLTESNSDISEVGYMEVSDDYSKSDIIEPFQTTLYDKKTALVSTITDQHCRTYVWNKLYKKELWEDVRFPAGKLFEDAYTTYKVINKVSRLIKLDCKLYYYYQRADSIVNTSFSLKKLDHCSALREMMEFMEKKYPNESPITSIKYFGDCLAYLQQLIDNRNNISNSEFYIRNLRKELLNGEYNKYLNIPIEGLLEKTFKNNYEYLIKQRRIIKIKMYLLNKTLLPFYCYSFIKKRIRGKFSI